MSEGDAITAALQRWFADVTSGARQPVAPHTMTWLALSRVPAWASVRAAIAAAVHPDRRPDLYTKGENRIPHDHVLLETTGLARAAHAAAAGLSIFTDDLAEEFKRFCMAPMPVVEDWILLDGSFPPGTCIDVGNYTLQTFTGAELHKLQPIPSLDELLQPNPLPPRLLAGAAFLHRPDTEKKPDRTGLRFPLLHTRPETLFWKPLITLQLWCWDDVLRMEALYTVRRGREVHLSTGEATTRIDVYQGPQGEQEEVESHDIGTYTVAPEDTGRLASFCEAVSSRIDAITSETTKKKPSKRSRRLSRAAQHLVRASHRTFGNDFVWEEEAEEVVLHYVIAMEALLSDEQNLDLSRKVAYRAASLWMTDSDRLAVQKIVKNAYEIRSKYAHGDDTGEINAKTLSELRSVALQVLLRWLITTVPDLPLHLDASQLSEEVRRLVVLEPLQQFFVTTPPAVLPRDFPMTS
ncbi:hypothetical protein ABZX30_11600 [Streptomyces sp. NPDC004542]|uniref:hypothetical protein n=1 Tax=Streptomyces sp. NPDC004542 TaxID=3154281 RepID=UPI0033AA6B64